MAGTAHRVAVPIVCSLHKVTITYQAHGRQAPRCPNDLRCNSQGGASTSGREATGRALYKVKRCIKTNFSRDAIADISTISGSDPQRSQSDGGSTKAFDLVAFSNLCVDIVVQTENLPPEDEASRKLLLEQLTANPPSQAAWEVGGNTNTLIAASRLGLSVASVGHTGNDIYGKFLRDILLHEGIRVIEPVAPEESLTPEQDRTLLCFVLVAPDAKHAFCSRYDFGPWPLLSFVRDLPHGVKEILDSTASLFINGFVFDEVPSEVVLAAAHQAQQAGAAVFFDPGPRAWTFNEGSRREALESILDASDVVLMTEEEAEAVTGCSDAATAARFILDRPGARTDWCVIKRGQDGALLMANSVGYPSTYEQRALRVDVRDTVGCGDSFAAAVILGYTRRHNIPATMALASAVGAATAMGTGAGRNVARAEDVVALLGAAVPDCEDGRHQAALSLLIESLDEAKFAGRDMDKIMNE